jgi:hypothetical protein
MVGIRPESEPLSSRVDLNSTAMGQFLFAEDEMAENEEAARFAFNGYSPLHHGLTAGSRRGDGDCPLA